MSKISCVKRTNCGKNCFQLKLRNRKSKTIRIGWKYAIGCGI